MKQLFSLLAALALLSLACAGGIGPAGAVYANGSSSAFSERCDEVLETLDADGNVTERLKSDCDTIETVGGEASQGFVGFLSSLVDRAKAVAATVTGLPTP